MIIIKASFKIPKWDNRKLFPMDINLKHQFLVGFAEVDSTATEEEGNDEGEHSFFQDEIEELEKKKKDGLIRGATIKTEQFTHTVFFNFDSDDLSPGEKAKISSFISPVDKEDVTRIEIIGYADDIGEDSYNLKLSEERAKNIAIYLMENKIKSRSNLLRRAVVKSKMINQKNKTVKVDIKIYTQRKKN